MSKKYPDVEYKEQIVDSMSALIIRDPSIFDVILQQIYLETIYLTQLQRLLVDLVWLSQLMLEMIIVLHKHNMDQHQILQENISNPVSMVGSTVMLLDWLGKNNEEKLKVSIMIENAIDKTVINKETRTPDIEENYLPQNLQKLIENL